MKTAPYLACVLLLVSASFVARAQTNSAIPALRAEQPEKRMKEICTLLYTKEYSAALGIITDELQQHQADTKQTSRLLALKSAALRGLGKQPETLSALQEATTLIETQRNEVTSANNPTNNLAQEIRRAIESVEQSRVSLSASGIISATATSQDSLTNRTAMQATLAEAEQVLEKFPNNALALYHRGYVRFLDKMYDSAAQDFKRSAEYFPPIQAASAWYHAGLCLFKLNQPSDAVKSFSKALEAAPFHAESYFYRGCLYSLGEQFSLATQDFTNAVRYNPTDAPSMGMLGSLLISAGRRSEGCIRLARSYQLGYGPALPIIEKYCNSSTSEDGTKIVRMPTVTVDAERVNYVQRIKNTKQGIAMALRVRSPFQQHSSSLAPRASFNTGSITIPDGNATVTVSMADARENLPSAPTSIPLQSIINKADCNAVVIHTRNFISIPCLAFFFAQEMKPFDNPDIQKIVKKMQQLADDIVSQQYAFGNVTPGSTATPNAAGADATSADFAKLNGMYDNFMALVYQLQNKLAAQEQVLAQEGKL